MGKILLADDSAHAQRMGTKILSAEGYEVATASNGQAAMKMLQQFTPDLILADIFMPGKNGYELCQFVKSDPKLRHIPIVLLVGAMEPYDPEEGRKARADGLVKKPFESSELVSSVQKLIASVKKPEPPPPPVKPVVVEEPAPEEPPVEEAYAPENEEMWATAKERLEIPEDVGDQPLSAFGDLLQAQQEAEMEAPANDVPSLPEIPSTELETIPSPEDEGPIELGEGTLEEQRVAQGTFSDSTQAEEMETAGSPQELAVETSPEENGAAATPVWTAEPAAVTGEDEKLFDQQLADWEGLTKMVQGDKEGSPSAGLPAGRAPQPPAEEQERLPQPGSASPQGPEKTPPASPPLEQAEIDHLIRVSVEEMMPQIVDRIVRSVGIILRREQK